jgi:hypothetical protein
MPTSFCRLKKAPLTFFALLFLSFFLSPAPASAQLKILPLGNSITQARNDGTIQQNSYRRELYLQLTNNGYSVDFVGSRDKPFPNGGLNFPNNDFDPNHEGHWGKKVEWFLQNGKLNTWLQSYDVDVALIHLGSNDMIHNDGVQSTIDELKAVIDTLRTDNPNIWIYLAKLIPRDHTNSNNRITNLNAAIPSIQTDMSTANSPIFIVDQNTGFDATTDTYDGTHPNNAGELKMATVWYNALVGTIFPVEWADFSGKIEDGRLSLQWETLSESQNLGFEVEHYQESQGDFEPLGFVQAQNKPATYQFTQNWYQAGKHIFRLKQIDLDGKATYSSLLELEFSAGGSDLLKTYPNPLSSSDLLHLQTRVDLEGPVRLELRDISGRLMHQENYTNWQQQETITLNKDLPAGVYLLRIVNAGLRAEKMIIRQ